MKNVIGLATATLVLLVSAFFAARIGNPVIANGCVTGRDAAEVRSGSLAGGNAQATRRATAALESRSGSKLTGEATFTENKYGVAIRVKIKGATAGPHGVHLHENGDCSAADAQSAGGHFNPDKTTHGAPTSDPHHSGDLGNITVGADGTGELRLTVKGVTVGPGEHSVIGRALVVHAGADDFKSQPAGNSGARFACGVVKAAN